MQTASRLTFLHSISNVSNNVKTKLPCGPVARAGNRIKRGQVRCVCVRAADSACPVTRVAYDTAPNYRHFRAGARAPIGRRRPRLPTNGRPGRPGEPRKDGTGAGCRNAYLSFNYSADTGRVVLFSLHQSYVHGPGSFGPLLPLSVSDRRRCAVVMRGAGRAGCVMKRLEGG